MSKEYKIGEVARLLGTTIRTIRYYEEEGLLEPLRSSGGTRVYDDSLILRIKSILHLADNGFSMESIRLIATVRESCKTGNEGSQKVSVQLDSDINNISDKIAELEALKVEMLLARKQVKKCKGCKNSPTSEGCPMCPVKAHLGDIEMLNLIWD